MRRLVLGPAVAGVSMALVAVSLLVAPWAAQAAFPGENGKIAFTRSPTSSFQPSYLFSINPDGTDLLQLTRGEEDLFPVWSPDGTRLAFTAGRFDRQIVVRELDGFVHRIYDSEVPDADDEQPAWSPDGTKIVFQSDQDGDREIYTVKADGSGEELRQLTNNAVSDFSPAWSPDGSTIAFVSDQHDPTSEHPVVGSGAGRSQIYLMDADGANQTRLNPLNQGVDGSPDWSPDGTKIAFVGFREGLNAEIFVMNADGTGETNLTRHPAHDNDPAWSPDGTKIVFDSDREDPDLRTIVQGPADLYLMNANGTDLTRLTTREGDRGDNFASWQPVNNRVPNCSGVTASPRVFEPAAPNQMKLVALSGATDPDGDTLTYRIDAVSQDEPVTSVGDGTSPDAQLTAAGPNSNEVLIRAERHPMANGRVYRIAYTVSDGKAGTCAGSAGVSGNTNAKVSVPRKKDQAAVDDGDFNSWNSFTGMQVFGPLP